MRPLAPILAIALLLAFLPTAQAATPAQHAFDQSCLEASSSGSNGGMNGTMMNGSANSTTSGSVDCMAPVPAGYENATPAEFEKTFLRRLILHEQGGVMLAQMAAGKAQHPELRALLQNMTTNQTVAANATAWLQSWYGVTPGNANQTGMMLAMRQKSANLTNASGNAYDLALVDLLLAHHASGIAMANAASTRVAHNETKNLTASLVQSQQKEIALLQGWRASWASANQTATNQTTNQTTTITPSTPTPTTTTVGTTTPTSGATTPTVTSPTESSGGGRTPGPGVLLAAIGAGAAALVLRRRA